MDISEARKALHHVGETLPTDGVVVVTRHGRPAFALAGLDYLDSLAATIDVLSDADAMTNLVRAEDDIRAGRMHTHEDVERELG